MHFTLELHHEKTCFLHIRNQKKQIICTVIAQLISAFVFGTQIVKSLCFLNPKFEASITIFSGHGCTALFVSDLFENPEDRFSLDVSHMHLHSMDALHIDGWHTER